MILLFFGQPASGKTTLASAYFNSVHKDGKKHVHIDGDKWRDVTKNKDYTKKGRLRNLKGAFDMALYLERDGFNIILSFITPYEDLRDYLSDNAKDSVQIYLEYDDDRGRNIFFADDFEKPIGEHLSINTSIFNINECVEQVNEYISKKYYDD
jgi:adenylylsulfate kinase